MNKITHSVVLSVLPNSPLGEILEQFCSKITSTKDSGNYLLHFWCSEVNASHQVYLEIVSHTQPTAEQLNSEDLSPGLRWRLPHHLVLLIADQPLDLKQIGFET